MLAGTVLPPLVVFSAARNQPSTSLPGGEATYFDTSQIGSGAVYFRDQHGSHKINECRVPAIDHHGSLTSAAQLRHVYVRVVVHMSPSRQVYKVQI